MKKNSIDPMSNPPVDTVNAPPLDSLMGRWVFATVNGTPVIVAADGGEEAEAYVEFTPPCYETGDGHCNEEFDGSWQPSEKRSGRLGLRGYSGCNWFGSEAILEDSKLTSKTVMATQRGCADDVGAQEASIQKILSEVSSLSVQDGSFEITSATGGSLIAMRSSTLATAVD